MAAPTLTTSHLHSVRLRPLRHSLASRLIGICMEIFFFLVGTLGSNCVILLFYRCLFSDVRCLQDLPMKKITRRCETLHDETLSCQCVLWMMKVKI